MTLPGGGGPAAPAVTCPLPGRGAPRADAPSRQDLAALIALVHAGRADRHRLAVWAQDEAGLLIPAVGRLGAPERPAARVGHRPADRGVVGVAGVVVAGIELDPVPVGI